MYWTDKQTDRQIDRQTDRWTDRFPDLERETVLLLEERRAKATKQQCFLEGLVALVASATIAS